MSTERPSALTHAAGWTLTALAVACLIATPLAAVVRYSGLASQSPEERYSRSLGITEDTQATRLIVAGTVLTIAAAGGSVVLAAASLILLAATGLRAMPARVAAVASCLACLACLVVAAVGLLVRVT